MLSKGERKPGEDPAGRKKGRSSSTSREALHCFYFLLIRNNSLGQILIWNLLLLLFFGGWGCFVHYFFAFAKKTPKGPALFDRKLSPPVEGFKHPGKASSRTFSLREILLYFFKNLPPKPAQKRNKNCLVNIKEKREKAPTKVRQVCNPCTFEMSLQSMRPFSGFLPLLT